MTRTIKYSEFTGSDFVYIVIVYVDSGVTSSDYALWGNGK